MKYKAIIFDFDGVLVDSEKIHMQASNLVFDALFHFTISEKEYDSRYVGLPDNALYDLVLKEKNIAYTPEIMETIIKNKVVTYKKIIHDLPVLHSIPGVRAFIEAMAEKVEHLGICTAAARDEIDVTLDKLEDGALKKYFKTIVTIENVHEGKPSPEGYLLAAHKLGILPAECLVIKDTQKGANAAKAAGMDVAIITTLHPKFYFQDVNFIADHYDEIASWMEHTKWDELKLQSENTVFTQSEKTELLTALQDMFKEFKQDLAVRGFESKNTEENHFAFEPHFNRDGELVLSMDIAYELAREHFIKLLKEELHRRFGADLDNKIIFDILQSPLINIAYESKHTIENFVDKTFELMIKNNNSLFDTLSFVCRPKFYNEHLNIELDVPLMYQESFKLHIQNEVRREFGDEIADSIAFEMPPPAYQDKNRLLNLRLAPKGF